MINIINKLLKKKNTKKSCCSFEIEEIEEIKELNKKENIGCNCKKEKKNN